MGPIDYALASNSYHFKKPLPSILQLISGIELETL